MYIIGENVQQYISKTKERIDAEISQNNFKNVFIIFVTAIQNLKDPELSDFISYYDEMITRKFIPVTICNDSYSETQCSSFSPRDYIIRSKI